MVWGVTGRGRTAREGSRIPSQGPFRIESVCQATSSKVHQPLTTLEALVFDVGVEGLEPSV